jgi:hypothetical protein
MFPTLLTKNCNKEKATTVYEIRYGKRITWHLVHTQFSDQL